MPQLPTENVQDYPRPPRLEPVGMWLTIRFGGTVIARTDKGFRVLETHHAPTYYLPRDSFKQGSLQPVTGQSYCEWKGMALYFDVVSGDETTARAAWTYKEPTPAFTPLTDYIAVYAEHMEACFVGDQRVTPQPGNFYGGWVTPNLIGQIKGPAGTEYW